MVKLLDRAQDHKESAGALTARPKDQADTYNFLKCPQEQVLAHGADKADLDLAKTLKLVEAETRPSDLLTSAGGLNEISGSQKKKFKGKAEGAAPVTTIADKRKCGWCNQVGHGGRPSTQVRRGKCKAFHHTCGN